MNYFRVFRSWLFILGIVIFFQGNSISAKETDFGFFHTKGTQIVTADDEPIYFRGVAFGNHVWENDRIPREHHGEEDFARVHDLGMNLVRFYLNYKTFESDDHPYVYLDDGWRWLDDNIAWAKSHGIYLILNIHIPQGGFQSLGKGWDLWDKPENQTRLIALWKAIADRYKNEPVILGYDLLNEPGVSRDKKQWQQLAQQLVDAIRQVDTHHPLIVERVNSVHGKWSMDANMNFVTVNDTNVIYEFHIYDPYFYTHQLAWWDKQLKDHEGGVWPDPKNNHTRKFLSNIIDKYLSWGSKHQVPLYLGEWGVFKATFENNRGGLNWVKDMIEILNQDKITNTYHVYHEEAFGLYRGQGKVDPQNSNEPLINLFREEYKN